MTFKEYFKKLRKTKPEQKDQHSPSDIKSDVVNDNRPDKQQDHGLRLFSQPSSALEDAIASVYPIDLIFIHGLDGHFSRTWTHRNGTCWPRDLLPRELPGSRVYSYGYPSKIFASKSAASIRDFAGHLLDDIEVINEESRPIIFVCHSLGGIVAKQAMIIAHRNDEKKATWSATKAFIFMGTPHDGSYYADHGKVLADIANVASHISLTHRFTGGVRTPLIESLRSQSMELRAIADDFVAITQSSNFRVISFYETEAHPYMNRTIVDARSAKSGAPGERSFPLFLSHQDLCRFSGPHDQNFLKVLDQIKRHVPPETDKWRTVESSLRSDHSFDETEKQCVSLLNTLDIAGYEAKIGTRVDGTLEWILRKQQYTDWISSPRIRLLWVTGYAGTGKTVLSSFVSQILRERQPKALVCRFFCDAKIEKFSDPCAMLRSLIYQLADQKRKLWHTIKRASDAGGFSVFDQFDSLWNLFVRLTSCEKKRTVATIIDSLDELQQEAHIRIFERITRLLSSAGGERMKFFITSRPVSERSTQHQLNPLKVVRLALSDNKEDINYDIRCVIHFRLEELVNRGICARAILDTLEEKLVKKADQTFLWIKVVLPLLEKRRLLLPDSIDGILNLIPGELESLYRHLLMSIPEEDQDMAAAVLRLLVVCDRPLTGDEIGIFITIKSHHKSATLLQSELLIGQDSVQTLLGSLVRIHASQLELVHVSLKDYLISLSKTAQDALVARFAVDLVRDRWAILENCWMYLSLEEFQDDVRATLRSADASQSTWREESLREETFSQPPSVYSFDLFNEPMFAEDTFVDESAWLAVGNRYRAFDFVALHWASMFRLGEEFATEEHINKAISLCEKDAPVFRNWFQYYWLKEMPFEPLPSNIDILIVTSFLGHRRSLKRLLSSPTDFGSRTISSALFWAARQAHDACFGALLKSSKYDPQDSGNGDQIPLLAASQFGRLDCVRLLLEHNRVDINAQDSIGRSALFLATAGNHLEVVKRLLAHEDINVNLPTRTLNTPLHVAIDVAAVAILTTLLADQRTDATKLDKQGRSILSWAAEIGYIDCVSIILDVAPTLVELKDHKGRTPLSYAAQHGHFSTVNTLIKKGHADPLAKDISGRNIQSWAASQPNILVLRYLLDNFPSSVDIPDNDGWAPVAWTFDAPGYTENFRLFLHNRHVNANRKDCVFGRSLLSWVASSGYLEMAAELINFPDVDLESRDLNGRTPLSEAAASGSVKIVQMLLATGKVDVNSRDNHAQTPLMWAAKEGHAHVVKLLLSHHDVNADICSTSNEMAVDMARKLGRDGVIATFEENRR